MTKYESRIATIETDVAALKAKVSPLTEMMVTIAKDVREVRDGMLERKGADEANSKSSTKALSLTALLATMFGGAGVVLLKHFGIG